MKNKTQSFFQDDRLAQLTQLSKEACQTPAFHAFVSRVLSYLRTCGFLTARFYECAFSRPANDELLILAVQDPPAQAVELGYKIQYRLSTLGLSANEYAPTVGSSKDTNQHWVSELGLASGRYWVDIPVRVRDRLIGLIAADWSADDGHISQSDLGVLAVLGSLVASVSELVSAADADRIEKVFTDALYKESDTIETALDLAVYELVNTMAFAAVAVFERSRGGAKLRKLQERIHPSVGRDIPSFDEEYRIGEYATGLAWDKNDVRHIVDFPAQVKRRSHEVEARSHDRHRSLLGEIKSVLYSKIENREPRFMVRIMNCVDSPLPIVAAQRKVVDRITHAIAGHIDDVIARQRLEHVIDIAQIASRNITRPHEVVSQARKAIKEERFDELLVVARTKDQRIGAFFTDFPKGYLPGSSELLDWSDPSFAQLMEAGHPIKAHHISTLAKSSSHSLFAWLEKQGYEVLLSRPFEAAAVKGFLAVPCREAMKVSRSRGGGDIAASTPHLIDTYSAIISSCIEGYDSHVTAEGSRKFMGRIGHEVRAPALDSAQAALYGLAIAQRIVNRMPPHLEEEAQAFTLELTAALETVNQKSREIDRMMDFAKLAALQEVGEVSFNFQRLNMRGLLEETVDSLQAQGELIARDKEGNALQCVVVQNRAVGAIGHVVGDANYLKIVFSHLLRNAAKYSLPRYHGRPLEIKIVARPEPQMAIIQIENWGVGIDETEFETIFRPHIRGKAHDRRKAISGLGLGLYVSSLLVNAHGGTVFCHHSKATLDDPERKARYEGFETVFEVRLPRVGSVGVREIELGGQKHGQ